MDLSKYMNPPDPDWDLPGRMPEIVAWVQDQKRVTVFNLMEQFNVDREIADHYMEFLQGEGLIGGMGFVIKKGE